MIAVRARAAGSRRIVDGSLNVQADAPPVPSSVTWRVEPSPVPADGRTEAHVFLEVRDAAGLPLEHALLVSAATHGTLGALRERGNGVYEHTYLAPAELPDGDAQLRVTDGTGAFERRFPIPLRARTRRLALGLGGGYTRGAGDASGPRLVVDAWVPFAGRFGAGLQLGYGTARKEVRDPSGTLASRTTATVMPLALRLGVDLWAGRRLSVTAGGGAALAWAEFRSSLSSEIVRGVGAGWTAFVDAGWRLGPGQVVLGLSYGAVPVETGGYRIDPGGLSATLVYRLGVL